MCTLVWPYTVQCIAMRIKYKYTQQFQDAFDFASHYLAWMLAWTWKSIINWNLFSMCWMTYRCIASIQLLIWLLAFLYAYGVVCLLFLLLLFMFLLLAYQLLYVKPIPYPPSSSIPQCTCANKTMLVQAIASFNWSGRFQLDEYALYRVQQLIFLLLIIDNFSRKTHLFVCWFSMNILVFTFYLFKMP